MEKPTFVTFIFEQPIESSKFHDYVAGKNVLLWGNPLRLGGNKYHIYGVETNTWERVDIELTAKRFIAVFYQDDYKDAVGHIVKNVREYLSPDVQVYVDESRTDDYILPA